MISPLPLYQKTVLIPRGKKQAKVSSQLVKTYGGIPIEIPLIAFRPVTANSNLLKMIEEVATYDWIIFTSNVTVETMLSFYEKRELGSFPKIAVIGERTESVLQIHGLQAEFLPSEYVAETFAAEFSSRIRQGDRILIPKGNLARDVIAEILRQQGAEVDEVIIYETFLPEDSREKLKAALEDNGLDILMFTSPSTVDHFMSVVDMYGLHPQIKNCLITCIGPVTKEKIQTYGLLVHASPEVYTVEEMVKSIADYLN